MQWKFLDIYLWTIKRVQFICSAGAVPYRCLLLLEANAHVSIFTSWKQPPICPLCCGSPNASLLNLSDFSCPVFLLSIDFSLFSISFWQREQSLCTWMFIYYVFSVIVTIRVHCSIRNLNFEPLLFHLYHLELIELAKWGGVDLIPLCVSAKKDCGRLCCSYGVSFRIIHLLTHCHVYTKPKWISKIHQSFHVKPRCDSPRNRKHIF